MHSHLRRWQEDSKGQRFRVKPHSCEGSSIALWSGDPPFRQGADVFACPGIVGVASSMRPVGPLLQRPTHHHHQVGGAQGSMRLVQGRSNGPDPDPNEVTSCFVCSQQVRVFLSWSSGPSGYGQSQTRISPGTIGGKRGGLMAALLVAGNMSLKITDGDIVRGGILPRSAAARSPVVRFFCFPGRRDQVGAQSSRLSRQWCAFLVAHRFGVPPCARFGGH